MKYIQKGKPKKHEQASEDAPSHYPTCSNSDGGWCYPPQDDSGGGIDPPLSPSPAMASEDAPSHYPPCSGSDGSWYHPPHNGSGGGIDPPLSPSPAMALENFPSSYSPCSSSNSGWRHPPHYGSKGGIDRGNCGRDDDNAHGRKTLAVRLHQSYHRGSNPYQLS